MHDVYYYISGANTLKEVTSARCGENFNNNVSLLILWLFRSSPYLHVCICIYCHHFHYLQLAGAALIGVGAYVQAKLADYFVFFDTGTNVNATAILIIAVGALTLLIGFFGCCGAYRKNHCMVMTVSMLRPNLHLTWGLTNLCYMHNISLITHLETAAITLNTRIAFLKDCRSSLKAA